MTPGNSKPLPVDRISDLPDSILGHILSFLPTRDAVVTGFLSQRWKFLWTTVIDLDFRYPDDYTRRDYYSDEEYSDDDNSLQRKAELKEDIAKYVKYVNYVLLLHKPGCLNKFSLEWTQDVDSFYVNTWISAALARNVHELFISTGHSNLYIQVQRSMFDCEGLQSLELNCNIRWSTEIVACLPKLESLKLISVSFQCEKAFSKLLAGCPRLKYLNMDMDMEEMHDLLKLDIATIRNRFPKSMFNCEGLQTLELKCNICISPETVISLPKLESLKLDSVYFQCEEAFCKLLAGCPVLKYLYIVTNFGDHPDREDVNVFRYIVSSDSLRHLELSVDDEGESDVYDDEEGASVCSVVLATPSLVYIKLKKHISSMFILENLSSLVEANLELVALESEPELDHCNQLVEAFNFFECAETLTLSSSVIAALSRATVKLKTRFKRLSKLKVNIGTNSWSSLQDFIELSDSLEVLTVNNKRSYGRNMGGDNNPNWKNPNQVPSCLSNSLKTVSFGAYDGGNDLLAMVGYLLEHGNALKDVRIDFCGSSISMRSKFTLVQKISILPMKSTDCKVEFL